MGRQSNGKNGFSGETIFGVVWSFKGSNFYDESPRFDEIDSTYHQISLQRLIRDNCNFCFLSLSFYSKIKRFDEASVKIVYLKHFSWQQSGTSLLGLRMLDPLLGNH